MIDTDEFEKTIKDYNYYLLHKPKAVVCSTVDSCLNDPKQSQRMYQTVYEFIESKGISLTPNLHPIGRLDADTTGIIIMTDDKKLLKLIRDPNNDNVNDINPYKEKEYELTLLAKKSHKLWTWSDNEEKTCIEKLSEPFTFHRQGNQFECSAANVTLISRYQDKDFMRGTDFPFLGWCLRVSVKINEGKNHQIRRMSKKEGYQVVSLVRTKISRILDISSVPNEGDIRRLTSSEIQQFYQGLS